MKRFLATASLLALVAAPAHAQEFDFDAERISTHVRTISADAFMGRAPNSEGEAMTVAYISGALAAYGIQPGGEVDETGRRSWTQDVPLVTSTFIDEPLLHMTIGGNRVELAQGEQIAVRAPQNGKAQVNLSDVEMVFAGYGTHAPERDWSDFKDMDVTGKVIVVLVNDPDFEGGEGDFGGREMTYYGRWTYKYEEAARRGAAGVLVIHEDEPASYGWATVRNSNTNTMFDIVRDDPAAAHAPMEGWITADLAETLFAAQGMSLAQAKAMARKRDFAPMAMDATIDAAMIADIQTVSAKNVVGILPGTEAADEYVIYSAHHDHLGVGEPDENGDTIYNGALDNGTGIALMLEQARAFASMGPQLRSVVFLAVGAEEKGLLGAKYYASNPLYPLDKTVGVINTDSQGVFGAARDYSISGSARLGLLDLLIAQGEALGRTFSPDPRPEAGGFFRSDHFAFAQAGVPAISFKSGQDLVVGGTQRAQEIAASYTAEHYHQQGDEWSADWDFEGIASDAQLLYRLGLTLASGDSWPNWAEGSEFKALRDASAEARD